MSKTREMKYSCPYCGREFDITVYESVNTEQDPDLRDACLSGDIFRHSCPHCHTDFMVQNPLVYIDAAHKFVIWLSSQDTGADLSALSGPLDAQGYKLRRCKTLKEFTEKIQIFEDGMDDVLVELAKYDSFIEYIDNKKGDPSSVTGVEYQRADNGVLKVNVRTDDRGMSFHGEQRGSLKHKKTVKIYSSRSFTFRFSLPAYRRSAERYDPGLSDSRSMYHSASRHSVCGIRRDRH